MTNKSRLILSFIPLVNIVGIILWCKYYMDNRLPSFKMVIKTIPAMIMTLGINIIRVVIFDNVSNDAVLTGAAFLSAYLTFMMLSLTSYIDIRKIEGNKK